MAKVQHSCTGCVPIDSKIIDVYVQLLGLKDSTIEAAERAEYAAEHAIGKSPYIGENGDWWEWDDEQGVFIDTGVQAQGSIAVDTSMSSTSTNPVQNKAITAAVNEKQDALVSGTNIKTVNGESLLGSGNIVAGDPNAVKYVSQSLTDAQKAQARTNIGATAPEVFVAIYGSTTYAEITAAITDGKVVVVKRVIDAGTPDENIVFYGNPNNVFNASYVFSRLFFALGQGSATEQIAVGADDVWEEADQKILEDASNKVSSWSSVPNDYQYPTEKLVKDSLDAKQGVITDLATIRSGASAGATAYQKPASGVPASDMASGVQTSLGKADTAYQKPGTGIPKTDLSGGVQSSLDLADSSVQAQSVGSITPPIDPGEWATKESVDALEEIVDDMADFAYNTSVNGIRYYDNQQWLDGTTRTTASLAGSAGRAAFYPILCKKGQVFHISVGYFGWQQTQAVSAAVVDENYTILERFHPSGAEQASDFQFTITADNAKYLLINSYNTTDKNGVHNNWYYTEPNGFISYLKKDLFRADSLVFNQYNKESKLTFSKSGTSVVVDFSTNPYIFSTGGKVFRLFPSDASTFQLTIPATNVCYVDASLVENSTFASPVYLSASDIKMESVSGAFDIKGKIVLALTTNASGVQSGLFNIGAIGHYYFDNLITGQKSVRSAFPDAPDYGNLILEKCPKFSTMMREKNKDVCVVFTGTSLTQGNRYTTEVSNPTECPPSLFANDLCGTIFRRLVKSWEGQKYRRYDHTDLTYTGTWEETDDAVVNGTSIWDDVTKRGLTKTTVSSGASVSIQVPSDAWQFNFIYRSDSEGGICTVSITEGNGKMEVYNGTAWVEANGYQFSMLEPAATGTKGNTCYQRRLKMRSKNKASGGINSIGTAKTLTITKAADSSRMNVVGFEWSPREFMFTLINGARRNYAWGKWNSSRNLEYFQDSDIWAFAPDLVVAEITVVNWNTDSNHDPLEYVNDTKIAYFNEYGTDAKSLWEKSNHYQDCEVIFYGDTFWTGAAADWDANGDAVFKTVASAATNAPEEYQSDENVGRIQNIFEIYDAVDRYMMSKDFIYIPVIRTFKNVAESFYGSYKKGFSTSGKDGETLTFDATHLNDNGAALWAHIIAPIFDAIIGKA